ncbi:putative T7SS-secreted protein [Streptomyces sp. NPDC059994]|uniref:putative T7SS-secreted protein n=1 Tax=Streptomyces sp. NPDC059994 TaxID=3347029 RepID=UPI0036D125A8
MPDWGKLANSGLGKIEHGIDWSKKKVGEGVDRAAHAAGDALEYVGAEGIADKVEDWADDFASGMGADVAEQQLGQTDEANELVHGDPDKIRGTAKHLTTFKGAFERVGQGMRSLDSSHWRGEAGDAFRAKFATHPTNWLHAADACAKAAGALDAYASTVTWAQGRAKEAALLYKESKRASEDARDDYNKKADAFNAKLKVGEDPGPRPAPFSDPGKGQRERAAEILRDARRQRNEAAETARAAVALALAHAPKEPPPLSRAKADVMDSVVGEGIELAHFGGGIAKGTGGLLNFVRGLDPMDPYNLTHPADYYKHVNMTLAGLESAAVHPDRTFSDMRDAARKDPSEFAGRMVPELIGGKGGGLLKGTLRAGAKEGAESAGVNAARRAAKNDPHGRSRPDEAKKECGDPVDVASGRVFLSETDVSLAGALPLLFLRRTESGYDCGRWLGPSWACTADQRLEIDAEGVIFVTEDGKLLEYPHPAPGVPVMPKHGPRLPLDRTPDGGYTVVDPETGHVRHFLERIDGTAPLVQIDDRNGNWVTFEYDADGAPASISHCGGYRLELTTVDGRITVVALAGAGELIRYGYTHGQLTEVVDSSGLPLRFSYDERGRLTSWTDRNDSSYRYEYDDRDRCVFETGEAGHLRYAFRYEEPDPATGLRAATATDSLGAVTRYVVNERLQIVEETGPTGAVTRSEWDRHHRLLSRTDALGRVTRLAYDERGNSVGVTRPDGRGSSVAYNELDLPVSVVAPDRTEWRHTYDERGNRTSVTDPAGVTTRFTFTEAGHLASVADGLGRVTRVRCDATGLPVEVVDPLGAITSCSRDAFGRPVAVTDPLGAVTRLEWTPEGRIARRVEPDGTAQSWAYDGEGNCLRHVDALGAVTTYEYTHFDLLAARTGPDDVRYEFTHDTELRLVGVANPQGLRWSYLYDPAGRLVSETDFDGRVLGYAYDEVGALVARTNGLGETIRYERNELDQVVREDAAGVVTTFEYDLSDQLARAENPDATVSWLRDRAGRLKAETVNGRRLAFSYDELGRRSGRTTPGGAASSWTYDAAGRRSELTTSGRRLSFSYDEAGREVGRGVGGTVELSHVFDALGRLTEQSVTGAGGRRVQHRAYEYRHDGNLVAVDDQLSGPRRFDLDAAGRVTAVHAQDWTERYAYDEAGNQTEASWPTTHPGQEATGTRAYAGTRITRAGGVRYEHDAQGRVVLRRRTRLSRKPDTWRYAWDAEDRLTSVTTPDGTVWHYRYDPLGRRVAKESAAGERVLFTWDGSTLCEQTTTGPGAPNPVTLTWDHDGLRPLAQTERIGAAEAPQEAIDERFFAIATDLVGTPSELIDERGEIAWRTRSTLWGTTTWTSDATAYTPLRFPGQYFDPETGLHYNYFRYYDPEAGRYLSSDPLGLAPTPNPAAYVHNPHRWADPLGLAPEECTKPKRVGRGREEAKAKALRDAGIPEGAEPFDVNDYIPATTPEWQGGKQLMGADHKPIFYRQEWYETPNGDIVVYQDHWFGHQEPGTPGYQGPHVHVRPYDDTRNGQIPGADEHYYYDRG